MKNGSHTLSILRFGWWLGGADTTEDLTIYDVLGIFELLAKLVTQSGVTILATTEKLRHLENMDGAPNITGKEDVLCLHAFLFGEKLEVTAATSDSLTESLLSVYHGSAAAVL